MFDPVTVDLIARAPPLESLDLDSYLNGHQGLLRDSRRTRPECAASVDVDSETEPPRRANDAMRRLAAAQEAFVAERSDAQTRAAAAFVAGAAHQLV